MKPTDKNQEYFGLDIGTTSVRAVQLRSDDAQPQLAAYGEKTIEIPSQEDEAARTKAVKQAIKELTKTTDITTKNVVAAISNSRAFTTVITTPKLDPESLGEHIKQQAGEYIPMQPEDARLDWYVLNPELDNGQMEVLLVAAHAEAVDGRIKTIKEAGLELQALEINALAVSRSVIDADDGSLSVIVDMGNNKSEITVVWRRVPYLISSVDVGGDTLTDLVQQSFNVDREQADSFLRDFGLAETKLEGGVLKATSGALGQIMSEIRNSIDKFKSSMGDVKFGRVVLTGIPVSLPGLPSYMANQLQLPAEIANPWTNIAYPAAEHDRLMSRSLRFAIASGLAQKDFV